MDSEGIAYHFFEDIYPAPSCLGVGSRFFLNARAVHAFYVFSLKRRFIFASNGWTHVCNSKERAISSWEASEIRGRSSVELKTRNLVALWPVEPRYSSTEIIDWDLEKAGFSEYALSRYSHETAATMINYMGRYVKVISSPRDVMVAFNGLSIGQAHHLNRSLRVLFKYLEMMGRDRAWLYGLRKGIPKDLIGIDLKVPEEAEIVRDLKKLDGMIPKYRVLWLLCLESGLRLIEAVHLISNFDAEKVQAVNGFCRYQIGAFRGTKQAYYAYFSSGTLDLIKGLGGAGLKRGSASSYFRDNAITNPKYLRKFAFDRMIQLEVPESVADFMEGRVATRLGAKHYMAMMRQADLFYGRYAGYLESLRSVRKTEEEVAQVLSMRQLNRSAP